MPDSCVFDPERECPGLQKAKEVSGEVKSLEQRLTQFQQSVSETNIRFGTRIGNAESKNEVMEVQFLNLRERLDSINKDMVEFQKDQKGSISELRAEHKESMEELKRGNKEILEIVTPLKHKSEKIDELSKDVEELKEKPGETWEHIKKQGLGWLVAIILALIAAALGLSQYT